MGVQCWVDSSQAKTSPFVATHHRPSHECDWWRTVAEELIVESVPRRATPACGGPVVAQRADHELAERVVPILWIEGAARRLLTRVARVLKSLLAEQALRLLDTHGAGVQAERGHEPH